MTTTSIPYNQTRTCVEDNLASAEYGKKMISLANQYRREGNTAAAHAAIMIAWRIHGNVENAIASLPRIAPEHAALMNRSERQQLSTELTASSEKLGRFLIDDAVTDCMLDDWDRRESEWYMLCLNVGHLAHLARSVAARVDRLPKSEDLLDLAEFAVRHCCEDANETIASIWEHQPATDALFPQTYAQTREQAIKDPAELDDLHCHIRQRLETVGTEADNSPGWYHLCGNIIRADDATVHTTSCVMDTVQTKYIVRDVDERYARGRPIMIWVRSSELRHWMLLVMQPTTSLRQLDQFLRDQWLECCGHMSHFEIGKVQYSACVPGPGDPPKFDNGLAEPDDQHMVNTIEETVAAGQRFSHEFDYGDTTCLDLEHVAALPFPYDCLPELIEPPRGAEGYSDDFIAIVARNRPPERCFTCLLPGRMAHPQGPAPHPSSAPGRALGKPVQWHPGTIANPSPFGRTAPHPFGGFGVNRRPFGRFRLRTRRTPRFAIFSLCERTPDPHELCGSISAPTGEHLCMPRRIGQPNQPNLRVAQLGTISDEIFANLDGAHYTGACYHKCKRSTGYDFVPCPHPPDKSFCDDLREIPLLQATRLFRSGIRLGMVSTYVENGLPKRVWAVDDDGEPYEAMLGGDGNSYHGYRLDQTAPNREYVIAEWNRRSRQL